MIHKRGITGAWFWDLLHLISNYKKISTCFLLDSVSTLFFLLIGEFVFMWLMWTRWPQGKFFSSPQTALLFQHEPVLQQLGWFQCWGLPCRLEYIAQLWSAMHLLFQPAALGFCQYTSILNYNTLCFTNVLYSQSSPYQLFQTFSPLFLSVHLLMLFNSYFGYLLQVCKYSLGSSSDCPTLIPGIWVTLQTNKIWELSSIPALTFLERQSITSHSQCEPLPC